MISLQSLKRHLSLRPMLLGMKYIMLHLPYRETRHPRRARGSQSVGEKRRGKKIVFKQGRKSPWVPTLTKLFPNGQADCLQRMLCIIVPIDKHHLLSSFGVFVHNSYCLAIMIHVWLLHQRNTRCQESFSSI